MKIDKGLFGKVKDIDRLDNRGQCVKDGNNNKYIVNMSVKSISIQLNIC